MDRTDKVQFLRHISSHLSHMCSLLMAFSAVFTHTFKLSHTNLRGEGVLLFYMWVKFISQSISQLSCTCKLILPLHPNWQCIWAWKEKEKDYTAVLHDFSFLPSLSCLHPQNVLLLDTRRNTQSCTLWWTSHMCHPVSGVFLSVWVGSGVTQQRESCESQSLTSRDSLPASHSQMANLSRITSILYNHIWK